MLKILAGQAQLQQQTLQTMLMQNIQLKQVIQKQQNHIRHQQQQINQQLKNNIDLRVTILELEAQIQHLAQAHKHNANLIAENLELEIELAHQTKRLDCLFETVRSLPQNSPLKRSIVAGLFRQNSNHKIKPELLDQGFSVSFAKKVEKEKAKPKEQQAIHQIKYQPNTKRPRLSECHSQLIDTLDNIAPCSSARNHRIVTCSRKAFYQHYEQQT